MINNEKRVIDVRCRLHDIFVTSLAFHQSIIQEIFQVASVTSCYHKDHTHNG